YPECGQPDEGRSVCLVRDGSRAHVWSLDSSGELLPVGPVPLANIQVAALGPGPRMTVTNPNARVAGVDLAAGRLFEFRLPAGSGPAFDARLAAGQLAVILHDVDGPQVVFFRVK
ncbi:MAG: hypothetical protein ACREMQ_05220, partial [Longimicrobiales bacterium]